MTAAQLTAAKWDFWSVLPPEIADDPRIKAKIADSELGPSPSQSCGGRG
ncbi:hypothetical protein [Streptomyces filipinensis]|nr:hypothetical protein [Streptomyces filipinensis]